MPLLLYPKQRYSVDKRKVKKNRSVSIQYKFKMLKINIISRIKATKKDRLEKQQEKNKKKYKKKHQTKKVQKRMKRSKHKANRYNKGKPQYNFFERLYIKFNAKFGKKKKGNTKNTKVEPNFRTPDLIVDY